MFEYFVTVYDCYAIQPAIIQYYSIFARKKFFNLSKIGNHCNYYQRIEKLELTKNILDSAFGSKFYRPLQQTKRQFNILKHNWEQNDCHNNSTDQQEKFTKLQYRIFTVFVVLHLNKIYLQMTKYCKHAYVLLLKVDNIFILLIYDENNSSVKEYLTDRYKSSTFC